MRYRIVVCPHCSWGPLVFDPNGIDRDEGMEERARCQGCDRIVLAHAARVLLVEHG